MHRFEKEITLKIAKIKQFPGSSGIEPQYLKKSDCNLKGWAKQFLALLQFHNPPPCGTITYQKLRKISENRY